MLTVEKIKEVVTRIGKKYGIKDAYLFGSYAKNIATESSDVDLIIDKGNVHTFAEYFELHEELERELGTSVDLLTSKGISSHFFDLIKNDRILVYAA